MFSDVLADREHQFKERQFKAKIAKDHEEKYFKIQMALIAEGDKKEEEEMKKRQDHNQLIAAQQQEQLAVCKAN